MERLNRWAAPPAGLGLTRRVRDQGEPHTEPGSPRWEAAVAAYLAGAWQARSRRQTIASGGERPARASGRGVRRRGGWDFGRRRRAWLGRRQTPARAASEKSSCEYTGVVESSNMARGSRQKAHRRSQMRMEWASVAGDESRRRGIKRCTRRQGFRGGLSDRKERNEQEDKA